MDRIKDLIRSYENWVGNNPETVSDVETTTKWVSYFIAGRISDSNVVSELVYSLSNMLVLYNDRIIKARIGQNNNATQKVQQLNRLKVILTTLEYSEVFIEMSARRLFGVKGKWICITLLQVAKAVGRLFILKHSTEQIITTPTIPNLNRRAAIKRGVLLDGGSLAPADTNNFAGEEARLANFTFQLKRSGRVVRKVEGAPPLQYRDFNLKSTKEVNAHANLKALRQAEYLYISKPLIHLTTMLLFGEKSWKQYATALTIDLVSWRLYHKHRNLMSKEQKLVLSRRSINLILYLMRSPFYERYTQSRLERVLDFVASIPIAKLVAKPIRDYVPHWQNTYYYLWST